MGVLNDECIVVWPGVCSVYVATSTTTLGRCGVAAFPAYVTGVLISCQAEFQKGWSNFDVSNFDVFNLEVSTQ